MWETSFPFCACKRDCVGKAASLAGKDSVEAAFGRLGKRCDFLSDQKVTKESPGDGSDERLRGAGAHSHLSPGPPIYGSGSLWSPTLFRRAKSRSVSLLFPGLRPYCHQNLQAFALYRTPPGACLPVWCGRHRLPSCPGSARLGGVRTAQRFSNF